MIADAILLWRLTHGSKVFGTVITISFLLLQCRVFRQSPAEGPTENNLVHSEWTSQNIFPPPPIGPGIRFPGNRPKTMSRQKDMSRWAIRKGYESRDMKFGGCELPLLVIFPPPPSRVFCQSPVEDPTENNLAQVGQVAIFPSLKSVCFREVCVRFDFE